MKQQSAESADGTRIAFTTLGSGDDVVVCPGSLSDGTNWLPVAEQMAGRLTMHIISRRGTGASGDGLQHSIRREVEDVLAVLGATGARRLFGHSYGAVCSLQAALTPGAVDLVAAYEPPLAVAAPIVPTDALDEIDQAAARGDMDTVVDTGLRRCVGLPDPAVDGLRSSPIWPSMIASGQHWPREIRAIAEEPPGIEPYAQISAAALLLVGQQTPPGHHHRVAIDALAGAIPDARVVELAGVGHQGHLQNPTELATTLLGFFT